MRAELLTMAAGILFHRQNYPRMLAKISGNLPAPMGYLREAIIVRVRADFLKPSDASFHLVPNTSTEVTTAAFEVNGKPSESDSVPKELDC